MTETVRVVREPLENRFSRDRHLPALITLLNSYLLWGGSRIYRLRYGVGINEWRILGELSIWPGATAAKAAVDLGINKAIVSRACASLVEKGLIVSESSGRARRLYLTDRGVATFDEIRPVAAEREEVLLDGLTPEEVETLRDLLHRLVENSDHLRDYDDAMLGGVPADDLDDEADD